MTLNSKADVATMTESPDASARKCYNITILSLVFPPDNVSTAQLMADLAEDLNARGHRVTVFTTLPHYNHDTVASAAQPMKRRWAGLLYESEYRSMKVYHAWMPRKGRHVMYRMLTWLGFHFVSTVAAIVKAPRPDVVLTPSPPLTIGVSAWLIARIRGAKFIYNVQEIYPDVAINLGAVRNPWLIRALLMLEQFVYRNAHAITVISARMRLRLIEKGVPGRKVALIPNFVDTRGFVPLPKDNAFSREHGLWNKFVVSYAGNMGKPQQLDILVEAAAHLADEPRIHFLLMGSGTETDALRQLAGAKGLRNVTFLQHQPYAVMPLAYAAMDACYVPQAMGTSSDGIPSKVYRILSSARPVLACTDACSDLASLVGEARAGAVVTVADGHLVANAIRNAVGDEAAWAQLGRNGRNHVVAKYDRSVVSGRYHRLICDVVAGKLDMENSGEAGIVM